MMAPIARRARQTIGSVGVLSSFEEAVSYHGCTAVQGEVQLKGWDFIQERILSHDEDMIGDFADDIDTLLVFVST